MFRASGKGPHLPEGCPPGSLPITVGMLVWRLGKRLGEEQRGVEPVKRADRVTTKEQRGGGLGDPRSARTQADPELGSTLGRRLPSP